MTLHLSLDHRMDKQSSALSSHRSRREKYSSFLFPLRFPQLYNDSDHWKTTPIHDLALNLHKDGTAYGFPVHGRLVRHASNQQPDSCCPEMLPISRNFL